MSSLEELQAELAARGSTVLLVRRPPEPTALRDDTYLVDVTDPHDVVVSYVERGDLRLSGRFGSEDEAVAHLRRETAPREKVQLSAEELAEGERLAAEHVARMRALRDASTDGPTA